MVHIGQNQMDDAAMGIVVVLDYTLNFRKYPEGNTTTRELSLFIRSIDRRTSQYISDRIVSRLKYDLGKLEG